METKAQKRNHILLWVIAILLGLTMNSCGAKKQSHESTIETFEGKEVDKKEQSTEVQTNVKVAETTTVDDKTETVSKKKIWSPVDPAKPASFTDGDGKKKELNNSTYSEETTTEKKNTRKQQEHKADISQQAKAKTKTAAKGKAKAVKAIVKDSLDKKGSPSWSWFWLLFLVFIGLVWGYLNNHFKIVKRVTAFFFNK